MDLLVNLPVGAVVLVHALRLLPETDPGRLVSRFGRALVAIGLVLSILGVLGTAVASAIAPADLVG